MTVIAALTDGHTCWVGGDSATVYGQAITIRSAADAKVFLRGPYAIGCCGSARMRQLIRYAMQPPPPPPQPGALHQFMCTDFADHLRRCLKDGGFAEEHDGAERGGNFIVGVLGHLFEFFSDYQIIERDGPYTATGCGEPYALGSLFTTEGTTMPPAQRLETAMQAAEQHTTGVRRPFHIIRTPTRQVRAA